MMELLEKIIEFFTALLMILGINLGASDKPVDNTGVSEASQAPLAVHYIDVGQADSTYIKLPDGKNMLIDAGENEDGSAVVDYISDLEVDRLDFVVGTHPHADHIGGMDDVIDSFDVGTYYMPDAYENTKSFESVLDSIEDNNVPVKEAKSGVQICKGSDYTVEILSPISDEYDETNDYSAVVRIEYGDVSFLFMGDAEKVVERELLDTGAQLQSDVLKVGHHGSSTSSSEDFIREVDPSVAIISSGRDNSYGHPHRDTVSLFDKMNITTLRTDKLGTIVVGSDGEKIFY